MPIRFLTTDLLNDTLPPLAYLRRDGADSRGIGLRYNSRYPYLIMISFTSLSFEEKICHVSAESG